MLILERTRSKWDDATRSYKVLIDGVKIGEIKNGETKYFDVPEGYHTLQLKIDWCSSGVQQIFIEKGKDFYAWCAPSKKSFLKDILYITIWANRYIDLRI